MGLNLTQMEGAYKEIEKEFEKHEALNLCNDFMMEVYHSGIRL